MIIITKSKNQNSSSGLQMLWSNRSGSGNVLETRQKN